MNLYEILVPTVRNNGKPIRARFHRKWDEKVRAMTGGLTILSPSKGQWVSGEGELYNERMIPVRIMCTPEQISSIADLTAEHYGQKAIMFYKVSDEINLREYLWLNSSRIR